MSRRRAVVVVVGLTAALALVVGRAVQIMVLEHEHWAEQARRHQEKVIEVPGARGRIVSADGHVLATSVDRFAVQLDTKMLEFPDLFIPSAAPLLPMSEHDLRRRIERGSRSVWLAKSLDRSTAEEIQEMAPNAVVLVPDFARVYPLGSVAAPIVGFVGREELVTVGRAGFEHYYDALLSGEPQAYLAVSDAIPRRLRLKKLRDRGGRAGYDLELTIHARLQAVCEAELKEVLGKQRAKSVSAVVLEVDSGSVLAAVSLPSFDPERPGATDSVNWNLRPVQDAYEPGSVVKPLVAAAALAGGAVRPGERFDCRKKGTTVAGRWVRDHAEPGIYTLDEVVVQSANTGIIEVASRVDPELLWKTFDGFGFGRRTGVGFPAEASGILAPVSSWSGISRASLALGQELTVSVLQVAAAYAAVANGGWLLQPRLVARATGGQESIPDRGQWRARVLDPEICRRLCSMMEGVVERGTGDLARVPGYRVAGKTGTAQRAVGGSFDDSHHVAWFAGFLPQPDPRVVVVVAVVEPDADFWASTVAAPAFARIGAAVMCHLGVPPTEAVEDGQEEEA